jgi:hypothetical protein
MTNDEPQNLKSVAFVDIKIDDKNSEANNNLKPNGIGLSINPSSYNTDDKFSVTSSPQNSFRNHLKKQPGTGSETIINTNNNVNYKSSKTDFVQSHSDFSYENLTDDDNDKNGEESNNDIDEDNDDDKISLTYEEEEVHNVKLNVTMMAAFPIGIIKFNIQRNSN